MASQFRRDVYIFVALGELPMCTAAQIIKRTNVSPFELHVCTLCSSSSFFLYFIIYIHLTVDTRTHRETSITERGPP